MTDIRGSVLEAMGNTPVVRLRKLVDSNSAEVVVKLEYYNPTGSYKDRMALAMIEGAESRGVLTAGVRGIEDTGGRTGPSPGLVCSIKGYPFVALSSDAWSSGKLRTMRAFGVDVRIFPSEGGKVTPGLIQRLKAEAERMSAEPGTYYTNQFNNRDAINGYRGIGTELLAQVGRITAYCGGVGTGGMLSG